LSPQVVKRIHRSRIKDKGKCPGKQVEGTKMIGSGTISPVPYWEGAKREGVKGGRVFKKRGKEKMPTSRGKLVVGGSSRVPGKFEKH